MKRTDFYYDLPEELIAQEPLKDRSSSRLMILDKKINIYPGHGPSSTLMYEAMRNPF